MGDGGCEGIPGECGGGGGEGDLNIYTATFSKTQRRKQNHGKKKKVTPFLFHILMERIQMRNECFGVLRRH